ncbi:hypothetical protein TNCV_2741231 [Trichonephila clavipes]|nr:hypothetical protein TNCV_2741231 [Trichonephila clavipes]
MFWPRPSAIHHHYSFKLMGVVGRSGFVRLEGRESVEGEELSGLPQTSRTTESIGKEDFCDSTKEQASNNDGTKRKQLFCHILLTPFISLPATSDLILELACRFQGHRFQFADEIKCALQAELKDMDKNGSQKCFDGLYKRWQKYIVAQKSYLKGGCVSTIQLHNFSLLTWTPPCWKIPFPVVKTDAIQRCKLICNYAQIVYSSSTKSKGPRISHENVFQSIKPPWMKQLFDGRTLFDKNLTQPSM